MTRENRIKTARSFCEYMRQNGLHAENRLQEEDIEDLERLEKIEALLNDPVNRASGSVSIAKLREALK